jgi:hypothetical protein
MSELSSRPSRRPNPGCHWKGRVGYVTGKPRAGGGQVGVSPGPGTPTGSLPDAPDLRISDRDRNAVADQLSRHFAAGRLDMGEFEERTDKALGARTRRDLSKLLSDLPAPQPSHPVQQARRSRLPLWIVIGVTAILAVALLANLATGARHGFPWFLIPIAMFMTLRFRRRGWPTRQTPLDSSELS